jgi:hypothetical protein
MCDRIEFTNDEWTEIYYAVADKLARVEAGDYSDGDQGDDDVIPWWIATLGSILRKIDPDGDCTPKVGVSRCTSISAPEKPGTESRTGTRIVDAPQSRRRR